MKKQIKKIGNSVGVLFNKEEQKIYKIKVNDIFIIKLIKQEKQK